MESHLPSFHWRLIHKIPLICVSISTVLKGHTNFYFLTTCEIKVSMKRVWYDWFEWLIVSAKCVWELIPIFIDVSMISVNVAGIGADATDEGDNTFWDANTNPLAKSSMLTEKNSNSDDFSSYCCQKNHAIYEVHPLSCLCTSKPCMDCCDRLGKTW